MSTRVIITGTGTPVYEPRRAGPGVAVEFNGRVLQIDAGRATVLRMAEADLDIRALEGVFLTHAHSDHVVGLTDVLMMHWLENTALPNPAPLPVFAANGVAERLIRRLLDPWDEEIAMRRTHLGYTHDALPSVHTFNASTTPKVIYKDSDLSVSSFAVRHEPVASAVGYRVDTPDGSIVVSGDTRVCTEVEAAAQGADILVYEAFCPAAVPDGLLSDPGRLATYHADTKQIGQSAARLGVPTLILTHLIPAPRTERERQLFIQDIRAGGYEGNLVLAEDLYETTLYS